MFILRDLLTPLQQVFSETAQGRKRKVWFVYTLLAVGLLKQIKGRWACLPLDFRFYLMKKDIEAKRVNACRNGAVIAFETKMDQAATMLKGVFEHYRQPVVAVTDSWFGNFAQCRAYHRILRRSMENRIRIQGDQTGNRQFQDPDAQCPRRRQSSQLLYDGNHADLDLR